LDTNLMSCAVWLSVYSLFLLGQQSNDLLLHLPTAAFVAVDEEMTGISVSKGRPAKDQSPAQRWFELKQAPERYSIIQLGLALFHPVTNSGAGNNRDAAESSSISGRGYTSVPPVNAVPVRGGGASPSGYTVRRYNFYMFPSTGGRNDDEAREVVLNPSTVAFLHEHNMSFDLWSSQGVPYTTSAKATEALEGIYRSQ
jgi:CAF1 family ribonuclease